MTPDTINDLELIEKLLKENRIDELTDLFLSMDSREIIYAVDHLDKESRLELITLLPAEVAADIIEDIPDSQASKIIGDLEVEEAAAIVNEMQSDEQADLIMDLEEDEAEAILSKMDIEEAEDVRKLISYDPDTAGGIMITEFIRVPEQFNVLQTIGHLRNNIDEYSDYQIKYLYVVDDNQRFLGVLQMQDLLMSRSEIKVTKLLKIANTVTVDSTLEQLLSFFDKYDLFGVPVIDTQHRIVGVALRSDVLEAGSEKLTIENLERQGIVGGEELRSMPVWLRSKRRLSWLSVNILLNIVAASVIAMHQETLSSVIALAVFLPIISDMSGCSGNQAVAVSMRELSIGTVRPGEVWRVWRQELSVGIINGIALGILIAIAAYLWKGNIYLGIVTGSALFLNTMVAVSLGGTIPLILKGMNLDPALASGPILTTITDMFGFFLALTFATIMLTHLTGM